MSDRELIELAAKAARIQPAFFDGRNVGWDTGRGIGYWNPLEDDGDCARLEARIGIDVIWKENEVHCRIGEVNFVAIRGVFSEHDGDRNKARRWASVSVAALCAKLVLEGENKSQKPYENAVNSSC